MALPDTPLTRGEVYLNAIANESSDVPTPITREEQYLNAIAKGDTSGLPAAPLTRTEQYLDYIAQNGGGGGGGNLLLNWDFRSNSPLVDTTKGVTLTSSGVTFDSDGAHFHSATDVINGIPTLAGYGAVEIDVGAMTLETSANNQRFIMANDSSQQGLIYRSSGNWGVYFGGWNDTTSESGSEFANSTIRVEQNTSGEWKFYKNGELWFAPTRKKIITALSIGYASDGITDGIIKAVRVLGMEVTQ